MSTDDLRTSWSYYLETKTAGHSWMPSWKDGTILCNGSGSAYDWTLSPLQAESLAILSTIYILYQAAVCSPITAGSAVFYCDNKTALQAALTAAQPNVGLATQADRDIMVEVHSIKTLLHTILVPKP
jgi:hypothetical protein